LNSHQNQKARRLLRRRATDPSDLSGRLVQAMTVRRHGFPMMMVMTVMAAVMHLFRK